MFKLKTKNYLLNMIPKPSKLIILLKETNESFKHL